MSNPYYVHSSGVPSNFSLAASSLMRSEFDTVEDGFDAVYAAITSLTTTGASTFTVPVSVPLGTVGAPGYTFTGDTDTGIYSPGANQLAITLGGTAAATFKSNGHMLVGTTTDNASGAKLQTVDGLTFPAVQVSSSDANTLDDYKEATSVSWTPVDGSADALTFTGAAGRYVKIGAMVYFQASLTFPVTAGAQPVQISGLPYSPRIGGGAVTVSQSGASVAFTADVRGTGAVGAIYLFKQIGGANVINSEMSAVNVFLSGWYIAV